MSATGVEDQVQNKRCSWCSRHSLLGFWELCAEVEANICMFYYFSQPVLSVAAEQFQTLLSETQSAVEPHLPLLVHQLLEEDSQRMFAPTPESTTRSHLSHPNHLIQAEGRGAMLRS